MAQKKLTARQRRELGRKHLLQIRRWLDRFGLNDWRLYGEYVEYINHSDDPGFATVAEVDCSYSYNKATVMIGTEILKQMGPLNRERNACHEALHILLSGYQHVYDDVLDRMLDEDGKVRETYKNWWRQMDEKTTESLVNVMMRLAGKPTMTLNDIEIYVTGPEGEAAA